MSYIFKVHNIERITSELNSILNNFSVTTTSGTINVNWGDGTNDVISSNTPVSHNFQRSQDLLGGFWNLINTNDTYMPVFNNTRQ